MWLEQERYLKSVDLITCVEKTSFVYWNLRGIRTVFLPNVVHDLDALPSTTFKKKQVIMAGRFQNFKRIEEGVVAFSIAHKNHPDWRLVIIGTGPTQESISNAIYNSGCSEAIELIPWTENVTPYFEESSIHLCPSHIEPFGLVITDAKKAKIPTIMYDLASNDVVRHDIDGLRVPFGNVWAMGKSLDQLMQNDSLREQMGSRAKENLTLNQPTHVLNVWESILNYLMIPNFKLQKEIEEIHFKFDCNRKDFANLIEDSYRVLSFIEQTKSASKKRQLKRNLKNRVSRLKQKFNNLRNKLLIKLLFSLRTLLKQDHVVFWDSNGVSFFEQTLANASDLKYKPKVFTVRKAGLNLSKVYYLAKAKVFVTNTNLGLVKTLLRLPFRPQIINTWHGCGYFKKFGADENNMGIMKFKDKFGSPDYLLCSSTYIKNKYAEIFGLGEQAVLPIGAPRTDLLLDTDYQKKVKKQFYSQYPQLKGKKLYLFAPTWRGTAFSKYNLPHYTPKLDFSKLSTLLREDEFVLFKNHQSVIKQLIKNPNACNVSCDSKKIFNVDHIEIQTLLVVCDVLVTDFSSVFYDALIIDKPILFYAEDVASYQASSGLYDDYQKFCPGIFYEGTDASELLEKIHETIITGSDTMKYQSLKSKFVSMCDGHSTKRLKDLINSL